MSKSFKILAIDTTTDACSVALNLNGKILEQHALQPRKHAEIILSMINDLLKKADIVLQNLDAFSYGRGPGSFTGIRIAASIIQGFAFGLNKPVLPISSLRALAQGAYRKEGKTAVFANLDARMAEIYWGLFKVDAKGIMQAVSEERVGSPNQIKLPEGSWETVTGFPLAEDIARLAAEDYIAGQYVNAVDALPVYLRDDVVKKNI